MPLLKNVPSLVTVWELLHCVWEFQVSTVWSYLTHRKYMLSVCWIFYSALAWFINTWNTENTHWIYLRCYSFLKGRSKNLHFIFFPPVLNVSRIASAASSWFKNILGPSSHKSNYPLTRKDCISAIRCQSKGVSAILPERCQSKFKGLRQLQKIIGLVIK